jgi:CheY-like chemotaxis protein
VVSGAIGDEAGAGRAQAATTPPGGGAGAYQLTLWVMSLPLPVHFAFNGLAAGAIALLGRPGLAVAGFLASGIIDCLLQLKVGQWLAAIQAQQADKPDELKDAEEEAGLKRLAMLSFLRICVYVAPPLVLGLDGTVAGMSYLGAIVATLVAVALSTGVLSPLIFWAMLAPPLGAVAIAAVALLNWVQAVAILAALVTLYLVLILIGGAVREAMRAWHAATNANLRLIPELEAAREEARAANEAKSVFLAVISHELRTPMNGVLGMAELLRREARDPMQIDRLEVLLASGERLRAVLDDIQDVARIATAPPDVLPSAVPLEELPPLAILAVDDNAVNLTVLEQLLGVWGHEVVKAVSGQEALDLARERAFDLVLMDIQMPGLTGIETLERLRAAEGASQGAPVIALTADVTSGGREHYLSLGFTDHATKPIEIPGLMAAMARAMWTASPD